MSRNPEKNSVRKPVYSKKILETLATKPGMAVPKLAGSVAHNSDQKTLYAFTRSLKGLSEAGLVEYHHSGQETYARLTREGRRKAHSAKLDSDTAVINPHWDGKWRIIILDVPEDQKAERDGLRYLLKKAGFVAAKNSVWISMYPFEHMFMNIKRDLGLATELMIFVTDTLDPATEEAFLKLVK